MKPAPEPDDLLGDVLAESTPVEFRTAVLGDTLRRARRRRWVRHARRATMAAAVACAVGALVWQAGRRPTASCTIVQTQPLAPEMLATTQPFAGERVTSSGATVAVISTADGARDFRFVDDDELLSLASPSVAALVRFGPHEEELIFVTPAARAPTPLN